MLHVWRSRRFLHLFARWNLLTCGDPRLIIRRFWYVTDTCTSYRDWTLFTCALPKVWIMNVNNEIFLHVLKFIIMWIGNYCKLSSLYVLSLCVVAVNCHSLEYLLWHIVTWTDSTLISYPGEVKVTRKRV